MATIAIKQPNGLLCCFSTVSCLPIKCNLTEQEFIECYTDLYNNCSYLTKDQILADAEDICFNHVHPWEDFYDYCVPPPYYKTEDNNEAEYFDKIEKICSEKSELVKCLDYF